MTYGIILPIETMLGKIWEKFRYSFFGEKIRALFPQSVVNLLKHFPLALLAVIFYRSPAKNLRIIGVTGTDGKTTTTHLVYQILKEAKFPVALVSTLCAKIGEEEIETGFHVTSPNPFALQKLLQRIVKRGIKYLVLEVTSQGLDQNRLLGCKFLLGVITNITPEHLDYHQTFAHYLRTKAKLFKRTKFSILNKDDQSFEKLKKMIKGKIITYGCQKDADIYASDINLFPEGTHFLYRINTSLQDLSLKEKTNRYCIDTSLQGKYNVYNCLAAIAVGNIFKIKPAIIQKALSQFKGLPGRLEKVDFGQNFKVFLDFAHTPNALENVLSFIRGLVKGKVIVVFGCAGRRDRMKRPRMGEIAANYANFIVLTAEDPRTEDVNEIIAQISEGCLRGKAQEMLAIDYNDTYHWKGKKYFFRIPDRGEAIKFAIQKLAKKEDIVIICGKGHEKSMCFGKTEYPWSDHEAVKKAFSYHKLTL